MGGKIVRCVVFGFSFPLPLPLIINSIGNMGKTETRHIIISSFIIRFKKRHFLSRCEPVPFRLRRIQYFRISIKINVIGSVEFFVCPLPIFISRWHFFAVGTENWPRGDASLDFWLWWPWTSVSDRCVIVVQNTHPLPHKFFVSHFYARLIQLSSKFFFTFPFPLVSFRLDKKRSKIGESIELHSDDV